VVPADVNAPDAIFYLLVVIGQYFYLLLA